MKKKSRRLKIKMQVVGYHHNVNKLEWEGINRCHDGGGGGGGGSACRLGLKMSTMMRPNMMSKRRKMHFRLPAFF